MLRIVLTLAALMVATSARGEDVAQAVRDRLLTLAPDLPGELVIEVLGHRGSGGVLPENGRVVVGEPAGRWPRARVAVPVELRQDGRIVRRMTLWAAVQWWREVDVYEHNAPAGRAAAEVTTRRQRVDIAAHADVADLPAGQSGRLRLARPVRAGQPVRAGDFEPVPDVVAGNGVTVEVERGSVRIRVPGRALTDGAVGDRIPVSLDLASQPVLTRVITPEVVRVEE